MNLLPPAGMPYNPDHTYQEMLSQQMKSLQMQQDSLAQAAALAHGGGGMAGTPQDLLNLQAVMYQNPAVMQHLLWMTLQQQQQQQQRDQVRCLFFCFVFLFSWDTYSMCEIFQFLCTYSSFVGAHACHSNLL